MHTWRRIAGVLALGTAIATPVVIHGGKTPADIPVRTNLADTDPIGTPLTIQSDALGTYVNGTDKVVSVLMGNVFNQLYYGDWEIDTSASVARRVMLTFAPSNAIPFGAVGYTTAPHPPFWGTSAVATRIIDKCTAFNKSVLTMPAGGTITCPLVFHWTTGGGDYHLTIGTLADPETTPALIQCNAVDAKGCTDWFLDPLPSVGPDGTLAPQAIARVSSTAKNGTETNLGDFYMTFHFHVTRP